MTDVTPRFKEPKPEPARRAWNSTMPAPTNYRPKKRRALKKPVGGGVTPDMRAAVYRRAGGRCQADGLHHKDCPGVLPHGDWSAHHVWPRQHGGPDELDNLIAVYCAGGMGLNNCHGQIHGNPVEAQHLGLLSRGDDRTIESKIVARQSNG